MCDAIIKNLKRIKANHLRQMSKRSTSRDLQIAYTHIFSYYRANG